MCRHTSCSCNNCSGCSNDCLFFGSRDIYLCQCGECAGCCQTCSATELGAEALVILAVLAVIFAVIGLVIGLAAGFVYVNELIQSHAHILRKKGFAEDYIVADLAADDSVILKSESKSNSLANNFQSNLSFHHNSLQESDSSVVELMEINREQSQLLGDSDIENNEESQYVRMLSEHNRYASNMSQQEIQRLSRFGLM